jgi:hypothetical protein
MIIRQGYFPPVFFQQGFATLTVALMISFLATFMTLYAARVGVMAQRISANEFRAKEAFAAAEAGIEQGIAYLRGNKKQINSEASGGWKNIWVACSSSDTDLPCGDGVDNLYDSDWSAIKNVEATGDTIQPAKGSYILYFLKHTDETAAPVFFVVAEGKSADGSGQALIKQGIYFYPFKMNIPDAPLMAGGTIDFTGTINVVTNPNGRGLGMPLSVWASGDVTFNGNASTTTDPYSGNLLSDKNTDGGDIHDKDPNFPEDIFEYLFGVPKEDWQTVKDEATVLASCDDLDINSSGLYWIEGDCALNNDVGSEAAPVSLVVKGNITINGNGQIYALIFAFSDSPNIKLNGGPTVYGTVISNKNISQANGTFKMNYDSKVLQNLYSNIGGRGLGLIPGSWADY